MEIKKIEVNVPMLDLEFVKIPDIKEDDELVEWDHRDMRYTSSSRPHSNIMGIAQHDAKAGEPIKLYLTGSYVVSGT